jgi:pyruvate kinase
MIASEKDLRRELELIREELLKAEKKYSDLAVKADSRHRSGCVNLIHYLRFRSIELEPLQVKLHDLGLSSLANAESHILHQINSILERLGVHSRDNSKNGFQHSANDVKEKSMLLFGGKDDDNPHIMVTFDKSMSEDYDKVKTLLKAGMNVARINTAHDDPRKWLKMIRYIKQASAELNRPCVIYMDLAGPKIRTCFFGRQHRENKIHLKENEVFFLAENGREHVGKNKLVGLSAKGILSFVKKNQRVLFDDGRVEAKVLQSRATNLKLEVTRIDGKKNGLKAGKGINFPDSEIDLPALSETDLRNLPFIASHAHLIGYSFVQSPEDIVKLKKAIPPKTSCSLILKIETHKAVRFFPDLLFKAMEDPLFGVMIARGDLAAEIGFDRLGHVQDELLWICEAARVPVIWATQVMESQNKSGLATRSEITDALHGSMAECIMINKGPHQADVIKTLQKILSSGRHQQHKKRYLLPALPMAVDFMQNKNNTLQSAGARLFIKHPQQIS